MKIALSYHFDERNPPVWSTPSGLGKAFERAGHQVTSYGFEPTSCNLAKLISDANNFDLIFFCLAGPSPSFDSQLQILRSKTKTKIFMELGDDVPFSSYHDERIKYVDIGFTPDLRCHNKYQSRNLPSIWMPCWCDTEIFYKTADIRENKCVTTCGDRPYVKSLANIFGNKFVNSRVWNYDNTKFFNSGTITYQYARYDEITRRLFEAGGCGLAILTNRISQDTGIYNLFKEDEDICYYSDEIECIKKMRVLLTDDNFRATIAQNMYKKYKPIIR